MKNKFNLNNINFNKSNFQNLVLFSVISVILTFMLIAYAEQVEAKEDFFLQTESQVNSLCPSSTLVFTTLIRNTGDETSDYTITLNGDAAKFSVAVPQGFTLKPGASETIYTYISPSSRVLPGTYSLQIVAKSKTVTKSSSHTINVEDCHVTTLVIEDTKKICPAQSISYKATLENKGKFFETYDLSLEGSAASFAKLSESVVSLNPGTSKEVLVTILPQEKPQEYTIVVKAASRNSLAKASSKTTVDIVDCYNYHSEINQGLFTLCEASQTGGKLKIRNDGTVQNVYDVSTSAANFVALEKSSVSLAPGSEATLNLLFTPTYGQFGTYDLEINIVNKIGGIKQRVPIKVIVEKCYDVLVTLAQESDKICNEASASYSVTVKNTGRFTARYTLNVGGADFATLDKKDIELKSGEEGKFTLQVKPGAQTEAKNHAIGVKAEDPISKSKATDTINIKTSTLEECFKPIINTKDKDISVKKDSSATIAFAIENQGTEKASYSLETSGSAVQFIQLNPTKVNLEPKTSKTVFLFVSPSLDIVEGTYKATITARLADKTIAASDTVNIKVESATQGTLISPVQQVPEVPITAPVIIPPTPQPTNVTKINFIEKLKEFFSRLRQPIVFNTTKQQENATVQIQPPTENQTQQPQRTLFNILKAKLTNRTSENRTEKEKSENVTSSTSQQPVQQQSNQENKTVKGVLNVSLPSLNLSITGQAASAREFLSKNRVWIVAAIIVIIIIILLASGLWKKISDFFAEEEIEEKK